MTDSRIQAGAFVRHVRFGVGRVAERQASGGVTVDFKNGQRQQLSASVAGNLKLLPYNGLEAQTWDGPEEIRPWIDRAPLKLIAAAIADIGDAPKIGEIKNALQGQGKVFDGDVKLSPSWWNQAKVAAADSRHFLADRNRRNSITALRLIGDVDNVPAGSLPPLPRKTNPATLWKKWLRGETPEPPDSPWPPKSVSTALAQWPAQGINNALHRTMWGAEKFLESGRSSSQVATAWLEALSRASMRWIECTWPDSEKDLTDRTTELIERLSRYAKPSGLPLFLGGVLSDNLDTQQSRSYEERLEQQRQEQEHQRARYESQLEQQRQEQERQRARYESQLEQQRQEQECQHACQAAELEGLRLTHAVELERERREQERLRQQVRERNAELAANREESRLEIRQDMLLAVGEVLQSMHRRGNLDQVVGDVEAGLTLALRAGGAETLETLGATVPYKPQWHHAKGEIPYSGTVKVLAPGVIVRGRINGDRVLLKAHVKHEAS